jgi:hypothetical protein
MIVKLSIHHIVTGYPLKKREKHQNLTVFVMIGHLDLPISSGKRARSGSRRPFVLVVVFSFLFEVLIYRLSYLILSYLLSYITYLITS